VIWTAQSYSDAGMSCPVDQCVRSADRTSRLGNRLSP
jgi:hypothetical protein